MHARLCVDARRCEARREARRPRGEQRAALLVRVGVGARVRVRVRVRVGVRARVRVRVSSALHSSRRIARTAANARGRCSKGTKET